MAGLGFTKFEFLKASKGDKAWYANGKYEPGAEDFLKTYYEDAEQNYDLELSRDELIAMAREFWMVGQKRKIGEDTVNFRQLRALGREKTDCEVIEIVTDDRRFLVESVIGEITSFGFEIVALFHPIVTGFRGKNGEWVEKGTKVRESMIQVLTKPIDAETRKNLKSGLLNTLEDLSAVVEDFNPMLEMLDTEIEKLAHENRNLTLDVVDEAIEFLQWLRDGNFVLLGSRTYTYNRNGAGKDGHDPEIDYIHPTMVEKSCLGVLRDHSRFILRESSEPASRSSNVEAFLQIKDPVTVAKSNLFSRIHRRVRMDYISIKHYQADGKVIGETRFVGLFTAEAYSRSPKYVPLLRRKVAQVMLRYGAQDGSHNAKRLEYVLSTFPRDELFQISEDDLFRIASGVAQAYDRPRTRLFTRLDPFKRFVSALVFVPRENYNTSVRRKIGAHLKNAFGGRVSAFYPQYSDSPLARVHFIIGLDPDAYKPADTEKLEQEIAEIARPWSSRLKLAAQNAHMDDIAARFVQGFSPAYIARFNDEEALTDIAQIDRLDKKQTMAVRVYQNPDDGDTVLRAKIYRFETRLELSDVMPIFTNMGLHVAQETGYLVSPSDGQKYWIHDYEMYLGFHAKDTSKLAEIFQSAFMAIWTGQGEDDQFNALILPQQVSWRRVAFLRLLARYRKQTGLDPSENVQIEALAKYPGITHQLIELLALKFDPDLEIAFEKRRESVEAFIAKITKALEDVTSLDHDRVLRRMLGVISAALRTNFYKLNENGQPQPFISLKIDSGDIVDLPAPKPFREIFVWSPRVEGVHLRFGPVARGGLRWSDRRDDFRTEVLGLVKAQQVKNAVIVPVGSKGGFYPKQLPTTGGRDAFMKEGIAAYTQFVSALLDITDTYEGTKTISPNRVVCWDDPDPYLVVAADKGTATFSDIANGIAKDYGFWLGDAFASGGSVGYDHKAMGITARGAWEAVKRHFREMGKDIQNEDFDVIGVGDMSGDVFGNGMLLSRHIRLLAAFDHRDVFIDPNPDREATFNERERLFNTPGTTWQDFDRNLISKGGGVFSRRAKSISLTPEIQKLTGLSDDAVTPNALIHALLKTECELLWFGGIGTYVKAQSQTHAQVRDKANDAIRVNGNQLKAKVIGEGANLGATQAGRIEFAKSGGRVNTDAIDNSAGVDCSDNEVNIKILLSGAIEAGELAETKRVSLLESMTDEVAHLVLKHNYDQTGSLSLSQKHARDDHFAYERFMESLEGEGRLDRQIEGLPDAATMQAMGDKGEALTRPEIAVLNAYAKIKLFDDLVKTDVADDPYYEKTLLAYFPKPVQGFSKALKGHRLRREIIASRLCNQIVDVGGAVFMAKLCEQTNASPAEIAKAFSVAYEVLKIEEIRSSINGLDNKIDADAQISLQVEIAHVLQRVIGWLVRRNENGSIQDRIAKRTEGLSHVDEGWIDVLSTYDGRRVKARIGRFLKSGIPESLASAVALLRSSASGFDVVELTDKTGWPIRKSAELFYDMGGRFKIDRLRTISINNPPQTHWEGLAQRRIEEEFYAAQASLSLQAAQAHIENGGNIDDSTQQIIASFETRHPHGVKAYDEAFKTLNSSGKWTLAKFAIVSAQLRELVED